MKIKKYIFPVAAILIACESLAFSSGDERSAESRLLLKPDTNETTKIIIGNNLFRIDENDTSLSFRVGNRGLSILESLEGTKVDFEKFEPDKTYYENEPRHEWEDDRHEHGSIMRARHFRGHWSGFEAGFNNYNHASSSTLPGQIEYMSLETNNSICFNINISQLNIGLSRYAGFVTGIGLNWNNYRFEHRNSIIEGTDGVINEYQPVSAVPVKRSKFSTLYLNVPVLLEIQIPASLSNSLNISGGFIGGLKLNAWTKVVFEDKEKSRLNGDYNLSLLRGGFTARVGYRNFMIYGTYYVTPWFRESMGPDGYNLKPFEIGIACTFND